jgi:hypothetical protein
MMAILEEPVSREQPPTEESCKFCHSPMPGGASKCTKCGLFQDMDALCPFCGAPIRKGNLKCTVCGTYQTTRRRFLSFVSTLLPLLVALFSVLTVLVTTGYATWRSLRPTSAQLYRIDTDKETIDVLLTNRSDTPVFLKDQSLEGDIFECVGLRLYEEKSNADRSIPYGTTPIRFEPMNVRLRGLVKDGAKIDVVLVVVEPHGPREIRVPVSAHAELLEVLADKSSSEPCSKETPV